MDRFVTASRPAVLRRFMLLVAALVGPGCAAVTNPIADGVPVHRLPEEIFPPPREELQPLPLTLLRQPKAEFYHLAPGDVLGVFIEGVNAEPKSTPPVQIAPTGSSAPAIGYPVAVQENGSITIPLYGSIKVAGLTIEQAQAEIVKAVTVTKRLIPADTSRIIVTLMQPRKYHVVVVRQDTGGVAVDSATGTLGSVKRGSGFPIDLPAGENDVLNALARTGGLPGLDANNEVIIQRGAPMGAGAGQVAAVGETIRIPLRVRAGDPPTFRPEDVILRDGDIVFIEARDTELFYTAGLLPPGEHVLPRDYDLDVIEAVARVHGPLSNGGFNPQNQFTGSVVGNGIGFPSPSLLIVLRKTCGGRQLQIRIDINKALRDPRERILVQPGDVLVLQEKPAEAVVRYITSAFHFNIFYQVFRTDRATGNATISVP